MTSPATASRNIQDCEVWETAPKHQGAIMIIARTISRPAHRKKIEAAGSLTLDRDLPELSIDDSAVNPFDFVNCSGPVSGIRRLDVPLLRDGFFPEDFPDERDPDEETRFESRLDRLRRFSLEELFSIRVDDVRRIRWWLGIHC